MNLQYYVLGKENNPMLIDYMGRYYLLLQDFVKTFENEAIKEKVLSLFGEESHNNFLLNTDTATLIEDIYHYKSQSSALLLSQQIDMYLSGKQVDLVMNQGKNIGGTNIKLSLSDNNPYGGTTNHPGHKAHGITAGWGEKTESEWLEVYKKTFDLLKLISPEFYFELNYIIKKIIPLGTSRRVHNSASYKECIGHLYMGYTIDSDLPEVNNLEAIIHESSHNKLNLIMHFDTLYLNDSRTIYYSPYRPDARHIHGLYLGVHAITPTVYTLLGAIQNGYITEKNWIEKIILYHLKNKICFNTLTKYVVPTPLGKEIIDEIKLVLDLSEERIKNIGIDSSILKIAGQAAKQHFSEVNRAFPGLKY